jgi:hypothetical protein
MVDQLKENTTFMKTQTNKIKYTNTISSNMYEKYNKNKTGIY